MSSPQQYQQSTHAIPPASFVQDGLQWYAVHTVPRHEKRVVRQLADKKVVTFLPLLQQIHRWSDRLRKVDLPLFSCYAFVRIAPTAENRVRVLQTQGVLGFVGCERRGSSIRDEEIESLQTAMREKVSFVAHPFITAGKRIRIRGGCLDGVEGILEQHGADQSLIVSVDLLQRAISIRVTGYDVELV